MRVGGEGKGGRRSSGRWFVVVVACGAVWCGQQASLGPGRRKNSGQSDLKGKTGSGTGTGQSNGP